MPRWNLKVRDTTLQSKLVELDPHRDGRLLTPSEVRFERLRLAHDMVTLVLTDGKGLPLDVRQELGAVSQALVNAWRATQSLP
jgi:hypothetical protein